MILDYRVYITGFVLGYSLLGWSMLLVSHDRAWKLVFSSSVALMAASALVGFLDWLWS